MSASPQSTCTQEIATGSLSRARFCLDTSDANMNDVKENGPLLGSGLRGRHRVLSMCTESKGKTQRERGTDRNDNR